MNTRIFHRQNAKIVSYCLVLAILFSASFSLLLNSIIQNTNSSIPPPLSDDLFYPNYIDDRLIGLGEWKEKLGNIDNLLVSDSIAYISGGDNTLVIYNITDITNPEVVSIYDSDIYETKNINLQDDVIVLSEGSSGFEIIDVTDPANPFRLYYNFNFYTQDTIFHNDYLIISDLDTDLRIFDAQDLTDLTQVAYSYDGSYGAYSIDIADHYAIIADGVEGLEIFDIQDILNPVEVGNYNQTNNLFYTDVTVIDDIAYVLNSNNTLLFFNISDITNPILINNYNTSDCDSFVVQDELAYVVGNQNGIEILNCSDLNNISSITTITSVGLPTDLYPHEDLIFVSDWTNGFEIYNTSDLTNVILLGSFFGGYFTEMFYQNNFAYLIDNKGTFTILNVTNPLEIVKLSSYSINDTLTGLYVTDNWVYLTAFNSGLHVLNITDLKNPVKIGHYFDGGNASGVYANGWIAYLADGLDGLEVIDFHNPQAPIEIDNTSIPNLIADKVYSHQGFIYVIDNEYGLYRINFVGDQLGSFISDYRISGIMECVFSSYHCYAATGSLLVLDISQEDEIFLADTVGMYTINDMALISDSFLITSCSISLQLLEITNPTNINNLGSYYDEGMIVDIAYQYGITYKLNILDENDLEIFAFDSDMDTIPDFDELTQYGTSPFDSDTDADLLTDYEELFLYGTNPLNLDSDRDGLSDYEEVMVYFTDPWEKDSDGDGYLDGQEVYDYGTDPLDPSSHPKGEIWMLYVGIIVVFVVISSIIFLRIHANIRK